MVRPKDTFWKQAKDSLRHVYWVGGATTAGKSTLTKRIADSFGIARYSFDSQGTVHRSRATQERYPAIYTRAKQGIEGFSRLLRLPPEVIAEAQRDFFLEKLRMSVDDLLQLQSDTPVIADMYFGRTLGELRQMTVPDRVVFLVPTLEFHRVEYLRRFRNRWKPFFNQALENCPDPEGAFMSGWVQYQMDYNQYLRQECRIQNFPILITAGEHSVDESYDAVCDHFHLSSMSK